MKLIVGLGNPGKEYEKTRHNIGFMALDRYAEHKNILINKSKFSGLYGEYMEGGEKYILLKPQKYMNLSGEVVRDYARFYKLEPKDILILSDDLDLDFGRIRLRLQGSSGGHNGLKNIEFHLKTREYPRIKIGISNNKQMETKDYVLGHLSHEAMKQLDQTFEEVIHILDDLPYMTFTNVMNKYNK